MSNLKEMEVTYKQLEERYDNCFNVYQQFLDQTKNYETLPQTMSQFNAMLFENGVRNWRQPESERKLLNYYS